MTQRVKAARALGGFRSTAALADELGSGLSDKTLRKIESGARMPEPHELQRIAEVCSVPVEFFTVDFARLAGPAEEDVEDLVQARVAQALGGVMRHLREQAEEEGDPEKAALAEGLSAIDDVERAEAELARGERSANATETTSG